MLRVKVSKKRPLPLPRIDSRKNASGVVCNCRIPYSVRGNFHRTTIRQAMLYCMSLGNKKRHVDRLNVAEIRMLRWVSGNTRRDKIRNKRC